ncbi:hypothetical protein M2281_005262 [Mesorhizobium soli]|uniref:hypothetical protein n=1 Tax=Pseudaminobacter soli (ex Li et al. 2025) TaxID=1295366 RepID=UPI002473BE38|nr:hypothetical protein [Mesorhizobium soli]MDH6234642.1 hypothetical protein [Mesorhizobium soli]
MRNEDLRRHQKQENDRIQQPEAMSVLPPIMEVEEMLSNLVWIATGEQVAHIGDHGMFLTWKELRSLLSASTTMEEGGSRPRPVPNAVIWQRDANRKTVMTRPFHAGAGIFCRDPEGQTAVNSWRPLVRSQAKADIGLFLEHVGYLFPDEAERNVFLDWLAHLEQKPGVLPHYGWLHVADHTGTGRNWLASVLARV